MRVGKVTWHKQPHHGCCCLRRGVHVKLRRTPTCRQCRFDGHAQMKPYMMWFSRLRPRQLLEARCSFTPTGLWGRGDAAAVAWHVKWNTNTRRTPKQLCITLVTQKRGLLLNFTADQKASAKSLGACVCYSSLVLGVDLHDFLICFSFAQSPHNERSELSQVSEGKATEWQQSRLCVAFRIQLACGLLEACTIKMIEGTDLCVV